MANPSYWHALRKSMGYSISRTKRGISYITNSKLAYYMAPLQGFADISLGGDNIYLNSTTGMVVLVTIGPLYPGSEKGKL